MKAKCRKCGDTVEVTRPREFKSCKCGAISLDYGDGYYYRVGGNPEDFDGEIEGAPIIHDGFVNISHPQDDATETVVRYTGVTYHEPTEEVFIKAKKHLGQSAKVKESFHNVNVDLCEDGTLYIDDAESDEQLAVFRVREDEKLKKGGKNEIQTF